MTQGDYVVINYRGKINYSRESDMILFDIIMDFRTLLTCKHTTQRSPAYNTNKL